MLTRSPQPKRPEWVLLALCVLLVGVAARAQDSPSAREPARPRAGKGPAKAPAKASLKLHFEISSHGDFYFGEPIPLTLTIQNTNSFPMTVTFPSGQRFDFEMIKDGRTIWNWAHERHFTQAFEQLKLKPGQKASFKANWDQTANDRSPAPRGNYMARAVLRAGGQWRDLAVQQHFKLLVR
jgi:hypothetical protein